MQQLNYEKIVSELKYISFLIIMLLSGTVKMFNINMNHLNEE